jgi:peptide deformylase
MIMRIRGFGDPILRQRANEVGEITELHKKLIENMIETMHDAPGVGLAAPQVGVLERIFVYAVDETVGAIINPELVVRSEETETDIEGCLSLPGLQYPVERSVSVTIRGIDENGETVEIDADGLLAVVFQHEFDHLNGVLFIDHLSEDMRKEALRTLRDQALGLTVPSPGPSPEERL